jgi:hypothetical protein
MDSIFLGWLNEAHQSRTTITGSFDEQHYLDAVRHIKQQIREGRFTPLERIWLHESLYQQSLKWIAEHQLRAAPAYSPVSITRTLSRRTLRSAQTAQALEQWEGAFRASVISTARQVQVEPRTWLGLALWSAISRSQLCEPVLVKALRDWLLTDNPLFQRGLFGALTIPLTVSQSGDGESAGKPARLKRANQWDGETPTRVHHFSPDALTLALIWRWLASERVLPERQKVIVTIRDALWATGKPHGDFTELSALCRHSIWLADLRPGLIASEALGEVAAGSWANLGLDAAAQRLCCGAPIKPHMSTPTDLTLRISNSTVHTGADWSAYRRLQTVFSKHKGEYPKHSNVLQGLDPLPNLFDPRSIEHLLVTWFIFLFQIQKRRVSTVGANHSRLTIRLIEAFDGIALDTLGSSDFELIYQSLIDSITLPITREKVAGLITQMHGFAVRSKAHSLPPLTISLDGAGGPLMVRARHIPASSAAGLRVQISQMFPGDEGLASALRIAALLAWRGGLRLGEVKKLRLRDIENSPERWLFIVANRHGSNKSDAARRQIPFAALLTDAELREFEAFMQSRKRASLDQQLLAHPQTGEMPTDVWISRTISAAMNATFGGGSWTFHHLRHAAANNVFLALEGEDELGLALTGWSLEQQECVRRAILGDVAARQKRYIALATFMGHASPQQTFASYIHIVEPVLAARRARQSTAADLDLYAAVLGQARSRIASRHTDADVGKAVARRLARWIEKSTRNKASQPDRSTDRRALPAPHELLPIDQCRTAMMALEEGATIAEAAVEANVAESKIEVWHTSAIRLRSLTTKYGKPRLFSAHRVTRHESNGGNTRPLLLPTPPKSPIEWKDSEVMFAHFRELFADPEREEDAKWAIAYVIAYADPSNSGLPFADIQTAARFIAVFSGSQFIGDRWHLDLGSASPADFTRWKRMVFGWTISAPKEAHPHGKAVGRSQGARLRTSRKSARLHLRHPNTSIAVSNTNAVKFTAPTLRYVAHILAIIMDGQLPSA